MTFAPGEQTRTISVTVNGDPGAEANETFSVRLNNAVAGTVLDGSGLGRITNDD